MLTMEIIPRKRVGNLLFGMTKSRVISILGHPDEIDNNENDWWYETGGSVSFDEDGLSSIEIHDEESTIFSTQVAPLTINEIQTLLRNHGFEAKVQYLEDEIIVACEMLGLFFVFFDKKLDYVQAISLPDGFKDIVFTA